MGGDWWKVIGWEISEADRKKVLRYLWGGQGCGIKVAGKSVERERDGIDFFRVKKIEVCLW